VYFTAHGANAVSPYLEWRLDDSPSCPTFTGGCFKYPLRRLQLQDTDNNIPFHINMHVYNNAGHYLSVATDPFQIPSRYPPGKSMVYDTDPEFLDMTPLADVDVHFKPSTLCASWTDSTHHETVSYEVGVGSTNLTDDIIAFQHVKEANAFCFNSSAIQTNEIYFFLLRSNCSAGTTISSSNGVTVLDGEELRSSLVVQLGRNCFGSEHDHIILQSNSSVIWKPKPLLVGLSYIITLNITEFEIQSDEAKLSNDSGVLLLIPFMSHINITIRIKSSTASSVLARMLFCPNKDVLPNTKELIVNWMFSMPINRSLFVYTVAVDKINAVHNTLVIPYQKATHNFDHRFNNVSSLMDRPADEFVAKVRICSITHCLNDVLSNPFTFDLIDSQLQVEALRAETNDQASCLSVHARWKIAPDEFKVSFHQFAIALDKDGKGKLTSWQSIANTSSSIQVNFLIVILYCEHN